MVNNICVFCVASKKKKEIPTFTENGKSKLIRAATLLNNNDLLSICCIDVRTKGGLWLTSDNPRPPKNTDQENCATIGPTVVTVEI